MQPITYKQVEKLIKIKEIVDQANGDLRTPNRLGYVTEADYHNVAVKSKAFDKIAEILKGGQ